MYEKTVWVDQKVENPRTYDVLTNPDRTLTLLDAFGEVTALGTPVNAKNMNHIEEGIEAIDLRTSKLEVDCSLDALNQSKALFTGTESEIEEVYKDIKRYERSSFDKSKIEIVGSGENAPIVTDDGILKIKKSGSTARHAMTYESVERLEVEGTAFFGEDKDGQTVLEFRFGAVDEEANSAGLRFESGGKLYWSINLVPITLDGIEKGEKFSFHAVETGEYALLEVNFRGEVKKSESTRTITLGQMKSGLSVGNLYYLSQENIFTGEIDLKSIVAKVNNDVYTFNKTGIDTIFENTYTTSGTADVTEDGIATILKGGTNFIKYGEFDFGKENVIEVMAVCGHLAPQTSTASPVCVLEGNTFLSIYRGTNKRTLSGHYSLAGADPVYFGLTDLRADDYKIILNILEDKFRVDVLTSDDIFIKSVEQNVALGIKKGSVYTGWGLGGAMGVDLNTVKVIVDGHLVYAPCLKIPYTLSETGSKIVDGKYRGRLKDLFKLEGYAPYYSISSNYPFKIIGNPLITTTTASNFTADDFLYKVIQVKDAKNYEINFKSSCPTQPSAITYIFELYLFGDTDKITCRYDADGKIRIEHKSSGVNNFSQLIDYAGDINGNLKYDNGAFTLTLNGQTYTHRNTTPCDLTDGTYVLFLGRKNTEAQPADAAPFNGTINLENFKFSINGESVISKKSDFTLPIGEIYGMIEQNKEEVTTLYQETPHITKSYTDDAGGGYNLYSNGFLEQWGIVKGNNGVSVTLFMPYKKTDGQEFPDYAITITPANGVVAAAGGWTYFGTGSITETGFKVTAHGYDQSPTHVYWMTKGYISVESA